jgi:hypothetical protein
VACNCACVLPDQWYPAVQRRCSGCARRSVAAMLLCVACLPSSEQVHKAVIECYQQNSVCWQAGIIIIIKLPN